MIIKTDMARVNLMRRHLYAQSYVRVFVVVSYLQSLTRDFNAEAMNILPASMQYDQLSITHEYTEIPDDLKHQVKLSAFSGQQTANGSQLFEITFDTMELSNQEVMLTYEPETVEDQQIIDSYGGMDNTPAYLVRLRPVLKVNDERVVVGKDGLPMGADLELAIELISPNGVDRTTNTHITGNTAAIGIVAQRATVGGYSDTPFTEEDDAETILLKVTSDVNSGHQTFHAARRPA